MKLSRDFNIILRDDDVEDEYVLEEFTLKEIISIDDTILECIFESKTRVDTYFINDDNDEEENIKGTADIEIIARFDIDDKYIYSIKVKDLRFNINSDNRDFIEELELQFMQHCILTRFEIIKENLGIKVSD